MREQVKLSGWRRVLGRRDADYPGRTFAHFGQRGEPGLFLVFDEVDGGLGPRSRERRIWFERAAISFDDFSDRKAGCNVQRHRFAEGKTVVCKFRKLFIMAVPRKG